MKAATRRLGRFYSTWAPRAGSCGPRNPASASALRGWLLSLAPVGLALALTACSTVPVSGRSQLILFSTEQDVALGAQAYDEILSGEQVIQSGPQVQLVEGVMNRLVTAVQDLGYDPGFQWEVEVLDAPNTANAFCLPGGKMAVYTGILNVSENEAQLATVMGHEIAHAIARHGMERMSRETIKNGSLELINLASPDWGAALAQGLPLLELAVFQPWGRDQELESDYLGLIFMAEAGYDPEAAVAFWQRMAAASGGEEPPEFLSTHPSNSTRIEQLNEKMPEARARYLASIGS